MGHKLDDTAGGDVLDHTEASSASGGGVERNIGLDFSVPLDQDSLCRGGVGEEAHPFVSEVRNNSSESLCLSLSSQRVRLAWI